MFALTWQGSADVASYFRALRPDGTWSEWYGAEPHYPADGEGNGINGTEPQNPSLFPWRTALENAVLGQELFGKTDLGYARDLLEKANLGEIADAYPHQLSGGMKQRVAFIRALLSPQPILCLDEPFSALDAFTRLDMQKWLLETWQSYEQSILFITHDIDEAIFLSDKIVILSSSPAEVKAIMTVPFERPRDESLLLSYAFLDFKKNVTEKISN